MLAVSAPRPAILHQGEGSSAAVDRLATDRLPDMSAMWNRIGFPDQRARALCAVRACPLVRDGDDGRDLPEDGSGRRNVSRPALWVDLAPLTAQQTSASR